jgi:hypothetical protein
VPSVSPIEREVWCGHDVFFIGMFSELPGQERVEAIARFGKVALPKTKIRITVIPDSGSLVEVDACLVESRSWGGESGSPVFLYEEHYLKQDFFDDVGLSDVQKSPVRASQVWPPLLGILHGHYEIPRGVKIGIEDTGADVSVNSGIAVVIPAHEIYATLMDERLVKDREELKDRLERQARKRGTPKPDSVARRTTENSLTKADFEAALKRVSRKGKPKK